MEGHEAMAWKDPSPGPESLMSFQTRDVRPDTEGGHSDEDVEAGFEKHGLSVAMSSPQEEGQSLPLTPQFGQKTPPPGSSLAERMQARTGFKVPKLNMPCSTAAGADNSVPAAPSPYLTIPPGLSPASLLESPSPIFISNAMGQPSPTTGKLFMLGSTNDNDPIRFGGPPVEDGPNAFSFKPLDLKSSHYTAEAMKEQNTHSSVRTEPNTQPIQEANLLGQLNMQNHNVQTNMNGGSPHDSKLSRLASGTGAGNEHVSPPDHGQIAEEGDAREDYPAMVVATSRAEDGYSWRKYGQKHVKHSEYPRSYFKCTHAYCPVKKKVERSHEGHITEIIYRGAHNHPKPTPSRRPGAQQQPGSQADAAPAADNNLGSSQQANAAAEANHQPWHAGVQDGVDVTSPGELCESSASMQVEHAPGFGSPEGADDVTSVPSDEVDGDAMVTHGCADADADGDELESKRRKLEAYPIDMSTVSRAVREPRVVIQTTSEVDILDDGYRWRKYGQKVVKGNPNPRSYYKCTYQQCTVRKHVERASHDLKCVITTYEGKHNHEVPAARNSNGHQGTAAAAATGARRPEHPSVHDGLMRRLGGCGVPFGLPPPRDPLAPMGIYPTYASTALGGVGPTSLPSLPMPPAGSLGALEGLTVPMLATSVLHHQHPLLRQRQALQAAAFTSAAPMAEMKVDGNVAGGVTSAPSVYQQMMRSGLRLGHQM